MYARQRRQTQQDYRSLQRFYSRDSVFNDETASKTYTGQREIVSFLKNAYQGVLEFDFNIDHMFNSNSIVVLVGSYHYKGPGKQFGKPGKIINIAVPGITTLKVDISKQRVKEHHDFIDYQTMEDQLALQ